MGGREEEEKEEQDEDEGRGEGLRDKKIKESGLARKQACCAATSMRTGEPGPGATTRKDQQEGTETDVDPLETLLTCSFPGLRRESSCKWTGRGSRIHLDSARLELAQPHALCPLRPASPPYPSNLWYTMDTLSASLLDSLPAYGQDQDTQYLAALDQIINAQPTFIRPEQRQLLLEWLLEGLAQAAWNERGASCVSFPLAHVWGAD